MPPIAFGLIALEMEKEHRTLLENTKYLEIGRDFVKVLCPDGQEKIIECDTVLPALGLGPVSAETLRAVAGDIPCVVIGDAVKPGKVDQATRGAYLAAIEI